MKGTFARDSRLFLEIENRGGENIIKNSYFSPPFLVMHPFKDGDHARVMVMSSSPGLLEGDMQEEELVLGEGARLVLTSQSYEKVYKMENGGFAQRDMRVLQKKGSSFVLQLLPMILFRDSDFRETIEIRLEEDARLILSNILVSGRIAMDESYLFKSYHSKIDVFDDSGLIYTENNLIRPNELNLGSLGLMQENKLLLSMALIGYGRGEERLGEIRKIIDRHKEKRGLEAGASLTFKSDIQVKALGMIGQDLVELSEEIINYMREKGE